MLKVIFPMRNAVSYLVYTRVRQKYETPLEPFLNCYIGQKEAWTPYFGSVHPSGTDFRIFGHFRNLPGPWVEIIVHNEGISGI